MAVCMLSVLWDWRCWGFSALWWSFLSSRKCVSWVVLLAPGAEKRLGLSYRETLTSQHQAAQYGLWAQASQEGKFISVRYTKTSWTFCTVFEHNWVFWLWVCLFVIQYAAHFLWPWSGDFFSLHSYTVMFVYIHCDRNAKITAQVNTLCVNQICLLTHMCYYKCNNTDREGILYICENRPIVCWCMIFL